MEELENAKKSTLAKESNSVTTDEDPDYEYYYGKRMARLPDLDDDDNPNDVPYIEEEIAIDKKEQLIYNISDEPYKKKLTTLQNKVKQTTYLKTSYPLMLKYDRDTSAFLSLLIDNEDYNEKRKQNGFFMATREYISTKLNITAKIQKRITDDLEADGLIECRRMGVPARVWIRLNEDTIIKVLEEFQPEQKTKNKPL